MEAQQQQQQPVNNHEDGGVGNNMKNTPPPSFLCRQSSTRWTPTTDQIRILKELYYNNGVRSPSADQIQRISARLRQYGKIEGKNVFYWFQNHKARERQKKRFTTTDHHIPPPSFQRNNNNAIKPAHWRSSEDHPNIHNNNNNNYPPNMINPPGVVQSPPPPGVFAAVGQMGSNCGYGSAAMEMSFRECSISPKDHINCGSIGQAPSYSSIPCPYPFLDKIKSIGHDDGQEDQQEEDDDVACGEIETLPLFPMHGEEEYYSCHGYNIKPAESSRGHNYYNGWYQSDDVNSFGGSSLELSLNSYITGNRSTGHFY